MIPGIWGDNVHIGDFPGATAAEWSDIGRNGDVIKLQASPTPSRLHPHDINSGELPFKETPGPNRVATSMESSEDERTLVHKTMVS